MTDCGSLEADETQKKMKRFVAILKEYPILLNVSMLPDIRKLKTAALAEIVRRLEVELNVSMSESQISKKIQNLKSRIKNLKAGKQTYRLKDWQKEFLDFMEGVEGESQLITMEGNNCWFEQGAVIQEIAQTNVMNHSFSEDVKGYENVKKYENIKEREDTIPEEDNSDDEGIILKLLPQKKSGKLKLSVADPSTSCAEKKSKFPETEETRKMSTPELKRLVLLEQLKFYREASKLVKLKLDQGCKMNNAGV